MTIDQSVIHRFEEGVPFFPQDLPCFANTPSRNVVLLDLLIDYLTKRREKGPVHILEVGSRAGGSALAWIEGINGHNRGEGKILCVDMWYKLGPQDDVFFSIFRHNVKATDSQDLVVPIVGDSLKVLPTLPENFFDLIYIDGAHCYSICTRDIRRAKALVKPGGIICGDDLEVQYEDCDKEYLEALKEQDAAFEPTPWHPGVTKAVFDNFGTVSPFLGIWAVQKDAADGHFVPVDVNQVPLNEIPSYFPEWATRVARHELGLETSPSEWHEQHHVFLQSAQSGASNVAESGDAIRLVEFTRPPLHPQPLKLIDIAGIQDGEDQWTVTSVNGRPEMYVSRDALNGLTVSVIRPFGTTDIGIQLPIDEVSAWRGHLVTIRACLRTNGCAQLNMYDGVVGFGDEDAKPDSQWQTLEWNTFLPPDAERFAPQIRLHGTRGAIAPGTHISIAWITVDGLQESASTEEIALMHCQRALHFIETGQRERAEKAMTEAARNMADVTALTGAIAGHGFSVPALKDQAQDMLQRHVRA